MQTENHNEADAPAETREKTGMATYSTEDNKLRLYVGRVRGENISRSVHRDGHRHRNNIATS